MIIDGKKYYVLNTKKTSYIFRITESGHLEHLYYGKKIRVTDSLDGLVERREFVPGNNNSYSSDFANMTLNDMCLEVAFEGKGDNRESFIVVENADGSKTSDFVYDRTIIDDKKEELTFMPSSYSEDKIEHLGIVLYDKKNKLRLFIDYYVYEAEDVITRTARILNESDVPVRLRRFMSGQLGFYESGYIMSTFNGAWAREMNRKDTPIIAGKHMNSSYTGTSSNTANPFFMLSTPATTEDSGIAYSFNLMYSGNHVQLVEVSEFGKTRVLWGINPRGFSWQLESGMVFESPEAVMTFSDKGFNGMSRNMHSFVREHVVRGEWAKKPRPVLLNSWEAAYFDINESGLLKLAKEGKDIGIELFVMDDGWFGERNDDSSSLGDWRVNRKKLPSGLKGLADKINGMGMSFGLWVEPEMVNVNSDLYRKHPDWVIQVPGSDQSEGRNQRILDLCRVEVQDYIINSMSQVFRSANISYVKWDMNRNMSDMFSSILDKDRQGEICHRYVVGLYKIIRALREQFPHILFEGCAAGGNRFDLGMLCYFPQIWASDDTDAIERARIQTGYSYGYPQSTWGAHVSSVPNHQTLRRTPLETRFDVASVGCLGYELNLRDLSGQDKEKLKEQIATYKKYRKVLQYGQLYRGRSFTGETKYSDNDGNITEWTVVSKNKKTAIGVIVQKLAVPNTSYQYFRARGIDEDRLYNIFNREIKVNIEDFGDLINTVSPIHIRQDSALQRTISRFYKLGGDVENLEMFGSAIMNAGIKLLPAYAGTGYNDKIRIFPDFASRLYIMQEVDK